MSEIQFVKELGDALETAISQHVSPARVPRRHRRPKWVRPRVMVGLAVLAVGGGVAGAAIVDQSTTTLVAHGLSCYSGTGNDANAAYNVPQNGQNPTAVCATLIGEPATRLVACADPKIGAVVYESNGDPNQCQSLGLALLPANYAAANSQVYALQQALAADYNRADCTAPQQLAQEAQADLQRLGFTGWKAVVGTSTAFNVQYAGPCGDFPGGGSATWNVAAALDATNHTVTILSGAARSIQQAARRTFTQALTATERRCYTLAGAQQLVRHLLDTTAGRTVPTKFAATRQEPGGQFSDGARQRYYDQGCTLFADLSIASDGQTFLALLENNTGAPLKDGAAVPNSAYQPTLPQG